MYKCMKKAQARAEADVTSDKTSVIESGEIVEVVAMAKVPSAGLRITRVCLAGGRGSRPPPLPPPPAGFQPPPPAAAAMRSAPDSRRCSHAILFWRFRGWPGLAGAGRGRRLRRAAGPACSKNRSAQLLGFDVLIGGDGRLHLLEVPLH